LNVDKPAGITSRDVVNPVERLVRPVRCGHAGTLDPLARGVLVVCVGPATRLIQFVQRMPKRYRAEFLLGRSSPTDDVTGEVTELEHPPRPDAGEVARAASALVGEHAQRPPAFSAVKVAGRRAYALARAGEEVVLEPRPVRIDSIDVVEYDYPRLVLDIRCGGGTYVRAIGRDLAGSLSTAAVMSDLVRTAVGSFTVDEAVPPDVLSRENLAEHLLPPERAVADLPRTELSDAELAEIAHGRFIARPGNSGELAAFDAAGRLAAILFPRGGDVWGPSLNFSAR
jgi:tRNA pseudouridine55 synthase